MVETNELEGTDEVTDEVTVIKVPVDVTRLPSGRIRIFIPESGWGCDVSPMLAELNLLYAKAAQALIEPNLLAIQLGRMGRTSNEHEVEVEKLMIKAACQGGVITGSEDPTMDKWNSASWEAHLLRNLPDWRIIRQIATHEPNWKAQKQSGGDENDDSGGIR